MDTNKPSDRDEEGDLDSICEALSIPASGSDTSGVKTQLGFYYGIPGHISEITRIVLTSNGFEHSVAWKEALPNLPQPYRDIDTLIKQAKKIGSEICRLRWGGLMIYYPKAISRVFHRTLDRLIKVIPGGKKTREEYYDQLLVLGERLDSIVEMSYSELRRMVENRTSEHPTGWIESVNLEPIKDELGELVAGLSKDYPLYLTETIQKYDLHLVSEYATTRDV